MRKISAIAVAMTLIGTSVAFAQPNTNPNRDRGGQQQNEPQNRAKENTPQRDQNDHQGSSQEQGRNNNQPAKNEVRDNPHFSKGDKLSGEYRDNSHVVSDWKGNHLRQPPRGYHWVQANNQYVLAAVATGLIADIMMSNQNDQRAR